MEVLIKSSLQSRRRRGRRHLVPTGENQPESDYGYRSLSSQEFAAILEELPARPLLAGEGGTRISLADAQNKAAMRIERTQISLAPGGDPRTHILTRQGPKACERLPEEATLAKPIPPAPGVLAVVPLPGSLRLDGSGS